MKTPRILQLAKRIHNRNKVIDYSLFNTPFYNNNDLKKLKEIPKAIEEHAHTHSQLLQSNWLWEFYSEEKWWS